MFVKLALANKTAYYLPVRLIEYRVHAEQRQRNKALAHLDSYLKYLSFYKFTDEELEIARVLRLTKAKRQLGLCLLETESSTRAKGLLIEGCSSSKLESFFAWIVTSIPFLSIRQKAIVLIRKLKSIQKRTIKPV